MQIQSSWRVRYANCSEALDGRFPRVNKTTQTPHEPPPFTFYIITTRQTRVRRAIAPEFSRAITWIPTTRAHSTRQSSEHATLAPIDSEVIDQLLQNFSRIPGELDRFLEGFSSTPSTLSDTQLRSLYARRPEVRGQESPSTQGQAARTMFQQNNQTIVAVLPIWATISRNGDDFLVETRDGVEFMVSNVNGFTTSGAGIHFWRWR